MITFDEKLEAAWGLHKIEKAVLEKEIAELRAENGKFFKQAEMNARLLTENASLRAEIETLRRDVKTAVMGDSAELTDVKRENEKLREALKPFAADAGDFDFMEDHDEVGVPVGDLRAAAAAIRESGDD